MRTYFFSVVICTFLASHAEAAPEQPAVPQSYLPGVRVDQNDPRRENYYGWSISASGDSVLVGMPYEFTGTTLTAGAAYVQRFNGTQWAQEAKLGPGDGADFDYFGEAVALAGNWAAIGAPDHQSARGAVYLFQRSGNTWTQQAKLLPSDPQQNARFGAALSFDGTTLAAAAPSNSAGRGAVYLFTLADGTWTQSHRIVASDGAGNDRFGQAVALDGNTLVVGAPGKTETVNGQGVAYAFVRNGNSWSQQARWSRTGAQAGEGFGSAVTVSGNLALASSPYAPSIPSTAGGVVESFIRNGTAWTHAGTLRSSAGSDTAQFGYSLSLNGARLLVGLAGDTLGDNLFEGSLESYLFEDGTWTLNQRMLAEDGVQEAQLGFSVSQSNDFAVSGAPGASNGTATYAGAVYAFENRGTALQFTLVPAQPIQIGQTYSASVTVSAGTASPTGSVLIRDDQGGSCVAMLNAGTGSCSLTATVVGTRNLRARYNGAPGTPRPPLSSRAAASQPGTLR